MKVKFFCPYWGSKHLNYIDFLNKAKEAGYDGVEIIPPYDEQVKAALVEDSKKLGLKIIAQWGGIIEGDFNQSIHTYEAHLRNACSVAPLFVNAQTGKDHYSYEQNRQFIELASKISDETGVMILHEIHRGKFAFAAHVAQKYLEKDHKLKITADFSHWCCVAESLLEDQRENVELAIQRTEHIHARVGFAGGPQIPDPRLPEWQSTLKAHLQWWDRIIQLKQAAGYSEFTITPEFGPFPYMTLMPFTQQPISSQWDINVYMKDLLNKRYN